MIPGANRSIAGLCPGGHEIESVTCRALWQRRSLPLLHWPSGQSSGNCREWCCRSRAFAGCFDCPERWSARELVAGLALLPTRRRCRLAEPVGGHGPAAATRAGVHRGMGSWATPPHDLCHPRVALLHLHPWMRPKMIIVHSTGSGESPLAPSSDLRNVGQPLEGAGTQ